MHAELSTGGCCSRAGLHFCRQRCNLVCGRAAAVTSSADKGDPLVLGNNIMGGRPAEHIDIEFAVHLQQRRKVENYKSLRQKASVSSEAPAQS